MKTKISIVINWIRNFKKILVFREFFVFYLEKIAELSKIPENKKYLTSVQRGFVGGYCSRNFLFYSPVAMEPEINNIAQKVFTDNKSRKLYRLVFLRHMYSSHFISGWERYYDPETMFLHRLAKIKATVSSGVKFEGNFFTVNQKINDYYVLNFIDGLSYRLPINWFEVSVFSFRLGLKDLGKKYLDYIKDKNVIDAGAFVGDSSIVLTEYTDKKILAVEPNIVNYKLLKKTIILNKLQNKIDTFNVALGKGNEKIGISGGGAGSRTEKLVGNNEIPAVTLDNLVEKKYQKIGLIKMDVEGSEMEILLGAGKIIKRDKPVLLISIYHSGEQFIKIPLYIMNKYSNIYNCRFIDCNPVHPLSEKVLVCLPKNIQ